MAPLAIAATPDPPCYVAVITVELTEADDGYFEMADAMYQLAKTQPGFLGMEWVYDAERRAARRHHLVLLDKCRRDSRLEAAC